MKKQLLFSLSMAMTACSLQAQVLNSGFENLNTDSSPKNWGAALITQVVIGIDSSTGGPIDSLVSDGALYTSTTDAYTGNYALELNNAYYSYSGTQLPGRAKLTPEDSVYDTFVSPLNSEGQPTGFTFYYKFLPAGQDTAYGVLRVFDSSNSQIGEAWAYISDTTTSYTLASVPVTYTSTDTAAFITIEFGNAKPGTNATFGTHFLIDDVLLLKTTTGIATIEKGNNSISCFPNPAEQQLNIRFGKSIAAKASGFYLTDVCGKQTDIMNYSINGDTLTANVESLAPGIYFATVVTESGNYTAKFVK